MRKMHLFRKVVFGLLLSLLTIPAFTQESEAWYENKPVKAVTFEGLINVKNSDLEGITSSFVGRRFTDEVPNELYDRLDALDFFESCEIRVAKTGDGGKTVKIIVTVEEKAIVSKIIFTGNRQVKDGDIKEKISIKEKDIFNHSKLLMDEREVRNLYFDKGFTQAEITSEAVPGPDGVVITFRINEGKQTVVKKILFEGNNLVSDKTLKSKISLKEVGLFNNGAYQELALQNDSRTVVQYYQNRGYVDAQILNVSVTPVFNEQKNREELTIVFEIKEGSQYTFDGVTFTGNTVFSDETLQVLIKLKKGAVYNETKFQESKAAVQNLYYENGYTSNGFDARMNKDAENKTVSYEIQVYENARSHIENIIIKGNTKTKEYVIRREIPIETGDIFSNTKITNGLRNLYNLQFFSSIVPDVQQGSEQNLVDLVFNVEEQSTTTLDFGFTFSGVSDPDDFPIALYAKIQNSNLFGEGRSLSAGVTLSTDEQSVNLGYGQNWLFGLPISTSFSGSYSHSNKYSIRNKLLPDGSIDDDYFYFKYQQHEFNLSASLGHRWTPDFSIITLTGGISGSLIDNIYDSKVYIPYDASTSQYNNNWEPKNSLWASYSMDGRNINYDPSKGWFFSERLSWYGLLPEGCLKFAPNWGEKEFYLRSDTKVEKYFTLVDHPFSENWSLKLVLMGYSGLSFQFPFFDSSIKQSNQLYIDGMFNGRGWTIYNSDAGRGKALWSNIIELRMPVVPGVLAIDGFFDAVAIKDSTKDFFTDMKDSDWYFSFGPSLRFTIQQFPLRLILANTFQVIDGDVKWRNQDGTGDNPWYKNFHFVLSFNVANK